METERFSDIAEYVKKQEAAYRLPITVTDAYDWSMKDHINLTVLYQNSQLKTGKNDYKPVKNIVRPILNLQHRATGFDVKDMEIYIDDSEQYFKSFMVKKFHDKWAVEQGIDKFIDELVESYCDFGGVLVKKVKGARPEVVPMQSIAFCDQTDLLSGPIAIKHFYTPAELKQKEKVGWGGRANGANISIDELITLSKPEKAYDREQEGKNKTPGKYIEVYEIHGELPESFLPGKGTSMGYVRQFRLEAFYETADGKRSCTLWATEEKESPFKFLKRDPIFGRALGMGGAEELFEPQAWINYDMIRMQGMLDAASKTIIKTTDPAFAAKHPSGLKNMENLEVVSLTQGGDIAPLDTYPRNLELFKESMLMWEQHAQQMGAANETIMGESPPSGTPFKLQALIAAEAHSLHEYRKGQIAAFVGEIYNEWVIPEIGRELSKEHVFMAEFDVEEMRQLATAFTDCRVNEFIKEKILSGEIVYPFEVESYKQFAYDNFVKAGNRRFIEIVKEEMRGAPLRVKINIAGKQKNLALMTDKLVNIFRFIFANPQGFAQLMQVPGMSKTFNRILEFSGLSPLDFNGLSQQYGMMPQQSQTPPEMDLTEQPKAVPV